MGKREDVLRGALEVFARDGYARAGIDTIAATACVSTRTIYNQFGGKANLFSATIQHSAEEVSAALIVIIQRHLGKIVDIEDDLIAFGREWVTPMPEFESHFRMVLQVNADLAHLPPEALEAWQDAGPRRVQAELARHLARIAEWGLLEVTDPDIAASQFAHLVAGEIDARSSYGLRPLPAEERNRLVDAGVRTFLYGHATRRPARRGGRPRR